MSHAASCRGLEKTFGANGARTHALRGVDVDIPAGRITFIVGPSGCGKTTLLSTLAGLLSRTGGTLSVLGRDPDSMRPNEAAAFRRRNLGFIFQQYNLLPALTAEENAAVPLLALGVERREAVRRAGALLERLGLGDKRGALPRQLSGGQQQRVAIARALVHEPALVLCDEPTAALDAGTGHAVLEALATIARTEGRTVVVVTHDNRIFGFADRLVEMEDGRVVAVREGSVAAH